MELIKVEKTIIFIVVDLKLLDLIPILPLQDLCRYPLTIVDFLVKFLKRVQLVFNCHQELNWDDLVWFKIPHLDVIKISYEETDESPDHLLRPTTDNIGAQ